MKRVCTSLTAFIPFLLFAQTEFTVAAGTSKTLTAAERTLSLKSLSLGDNSSIIIPPDMNGWTVTATDVTIGTNVKIFAQGRDAMPQSTVVENSAVASACLAGRNGYSASPGFNGIPGKTVSLDLKIRSIGSLTIYAQGGRGASGSQGQKGGKGGSATCTCNAGAGGAGGNGGRGGDGANGGNVTIVYGKIGNVSVSNSNFVVQNPGGTGGAGGAGGEGGAGGDAGGCSDPKAAIKPAGAKGQSGRPGAAGSAGANGITTIQAK